MRAAAILATALALGAAGCSATPPAAARATPAALPSALPLPATWTTHADRAQGFAVATPDAWDVAVRDSPTLPADLDAVGKNSPELAAFFKKALDSNPDLSLVAADPRSVAQGFAANANVMTANLGAVAGAPALADVVEAKLTRLRTEAAVSQPVRHSNARLAGQPAVRLDYTLKAGDQDIVVRSYLLVVDRGGQRRRLELTMGAPGEQGTAGTFDSIALSFSVTAATRGGAGLP